MTESYIFYAYTHIFDTDTLWVINISIFTLAVGSAHRLASLYTELHTFWTLCECMFLYSCRDHLVLEGCFHVLITEVSSTECRNPYIFLENQFIISYFFHCCLLFKLWVCYSLWFSLDWVWIVHKSCNLLACFLRFSYVTSLTLTFDGIFHYELPIYLFLRLLV